MRLSPPRLAGTLAVLLLLALPSAANAYLGPGVGLSVIGVVLGFLGSIVLGFFAVLWYPVKRLLRRRRQSPPAPVIVDIVEPGE